MTAPLTFAFPKGRIAAQLASLLARPPLGLPAFSGRDLVVEAPEQGLRALLLKDFDVPTYVARGVAEVGVVGSDVLEERESDLPTPLEFSFGRCRLVLLAPGSARELPTGRAVRVATKYTHLTREFFDQKGMAADVVSLAGSVELAPRMGLADLVADLVDTGATMRANGLVELETMREVSPRLVVSRAAIARRRREVFRFAELLEEMMAAA